jgi:hypothetical protein
LCGRICIAECNKHKDSEILFEIVVTRALKFRDGSNNTPKNLIETIDKFNWRYKMIAHWARIIVKIDNN